jgi:hypothetical protein
LPSEESNIFLFTAERVNEYSSFPKVDFLIIDEFYKLSAKRDDERSDSLNNAFQYLLNKFDCKFYLLGPNIDGISEGFAKKYNAKFHKTGVSLVDNRTIDIYTPNKEQFDKTTHHRKNGFKEANEFKENLLFESLLSNGEQSIIYCSSPARVRNLSLKFKNYLVVNEIKKKDQNLDVIEWINRYVSKDWSVIDLLEYEIGIHDGALQKHITSTVINYFNNKKINYLFCTSTIIEGVNTSAKNVFYFDSVKGIRTPIDYFDYSNIKGRAGRLMIHYVGNIFNFNPVPEKTKLTIIDIPFHDQLNISDEILIYIPDENVINKESDQYRLLKELPESERNVFKKNGVVINGQKSILGELRNSVLTHYELIFWEGIPTYRQLEYALTLAWNNLIKPGESISPMTLKKLIKVTFDYGKDKQISQLIAGNFKYLKGLKENSQKTDSQIRDEAIMVSFQILKHWFQYKVPKWLSVINELQKFVCNEIGRRPGNYLFYSSLIENDFIRENLAILSEYGIPSSAIRKLEQFIPANLSQDEVLKFVQQRELHNNRVFINYERNKFLENY